MVNVLDATAVGTDVSLQTAASMLLAPKGEKVMLMSDIWMQTLFSTTYHYALREHAARWAGASQPMLLAIKAAMLGGMSVMSDVAAGGRLRLLPALGTAAGAVAGEYALPEVLTLTGMN